MKKKLDGSEGFICLKQYPTVSYKWLGRVLIIPFYVAKLFSERVTELSLCFANACLFSISTSYTIDDIGGGAREMICNLDGSLGS